MVFFRGLNTRLVDIFVRGRRFEAGVAKLGQRRWDEVPVSMSSQVQILPSAPPTILKSKGTLCLGSEILSCGVKDVPAT